MRTTFAVVFLVLLALSIVAWKIEPPPPGGNRTTLVWSTDNNPVRKGQVELFNRMNPDLFLMIDPANTDQQKIIVQSVGGVGPDVFEGYSAENIETFVRSGIAMDITDELRSHGVDASMTWPVIRPSITYEGRTYAFPRNVGANAIWFNKDVFDEEGVPYPKPGWTWDDLIATAKRLTKRDARGKPSRFGIYWDWNAYQDLVFQFDGRLFSKDGTRCTADTPEATAGVSLGYDLMYRHRVAPSPTQEAALTTQGGWGSGGMTFLMGGRCAMAYGGRWWLNLMRSQKGLRVGCVEIPYARRPATVGYGGAVFVNKYGKHTKEAARFVAWLASREYNELCNDQADGLAPVRKFAFDKRFLYNPQHPEEDYNLVWRSALEKGMEAEATPFLRGSDLAMLRNQLDLVKAGLKDPESACRQGALDSNERILRNARMKPHLRALYLERVGREP